MRKIIFLDIDGPLIPAGQYLINRICSFERDCPSIPIAILNKLCKDAEAKIVTNSSHNYHNSTTGNLKQDLMACGIKKEYFHENWRTIYPNIVVTESKRHPRKAAIDMWIEENGETDWICFDDCKFIEHDRLIYVNFDHGLNVTHLNEALKFWGLDNFIVL